MNWLDHEIERIERRIEKVRRNPDPTRLRSNGVLYECELEMYNAQREAIRAGTPPLIFTISPLFPLMKSMGFQVFDYARVADMQMRGDDYAAVANAMGFPEKSCDRTVVEIGMIARGDVPDPQFVVASNIACDPLFYSGAAVAQHLGLPYYLLDIPLEENEANLAYVTEQLREIIGLMEDAFPGHKYDEEQLRYLHECNRQAFDYMQRSFWLRRHRPSPLSTMDCFRLPPLPSDYPDPHKALRYHKALLEELEAKMAAPTQVEEKLRVMWTCSGPYFANPFAVLDRKGARVTVFLFDEVARMYAGLDPSYGDEQYGRKLTPLEEEARMAFCCSWMGKGARWIKAIIDISKGLDVEAIVNFVQVGCTATVGLGQLIADSAEREGIPVLNIEGRQMVVNDYNKDAFESQLDQFIDLCLARKAAQAARPVP